MKFKVWKAGFGAYGEFVRGGWGDWGRGWRAVFPNKHCHLLFYLGGWGCANYNPPPSPASLYGWIVVEASIWLIRSAPAQIIIHALSLYLTHLNQYSFPLSFPPSFFIPSFLPKLFNSLYSIKPFFPSGQNINFELTKHFAGRQVDEPMKGQSH